MSCPSPLLHFTGSTNLHLFSGSQIFDQMDHQSIFSDAIRDKTYWQTFWLKTRLKFRMYEKTSTVTRLTVCRSTCRLLSRHYPQADKPLNLSSYFFMACCDATYLDVPHSARPLFYDHRSRAVNFTLRWWHTLTANMNFLLKKPCFAAWHQSSCQCRSVSGGRGRGWCTQSGILSYLAVRWEPRLCNLRVVLVKTFLSCCLV